MPEEESTGTSTESKAKKNFITQKLGPFPLWAWVVLAAGVAGAYIIVKRHQTAGTPTVGQQAGVPGGVGITSPDALTSEDTLQLLNTLNTTLGNLPSQLQASSTQQNTSSNSSGISLYTLVTRGLTKEEQGLTNPELPIHSAPDPQSGVIESVPFNSNIFTTGRAISGASNTIDNIAAYATSNLWYPIPLPGGGTGYLSSIDVGSSSPLSTGTLPVPAVLNTQRSTSSGGHPAQSISGT